MTSSAQAALDATRAQRAAVIRWLRPLGPLVMAVVVWSCATSDPRPALSGPGRPVLVALAVFVLAGAGSVLTSDRLLRAHLGLVTALLAASATLVWLQPHSAAVAGIFVGVSFLAPLLRGHLSVPVTVVALILLAVAVSSARSGPIIDAILDAVMVGAYYGMLVFALRLGQANHQAERLVEELERGRAAQAEAARLSERQRLAREMHDLLAHSLTGLMLQLEGARLLAARAPDDPRLPAALERAQQLGRAGLDEARRAIGLLRDDELPSLAELTRSFAHDHGVRCEHTTEGTERPLASPARLAVYRVAQEALTNVTRHAGATVVELVVAQHEDGVELRVSDDGSGFDPAVLPHVNSLTPGRGLGLIGMAERARLVGGELDVRSAPGGGTTITLRVPT
jgi:signal transduction histidine kinase